MSRFADYRGRVFNTGFADQDVERLFSGHTPKDPELAQLTMFIEALRSYRTVAPSIDALERVSVQAAAIARSSQYEPSDLALRGSERPGRRRLTGSRRVAIAAIAAVVLIAMSGVAVAANGAAPGHPLYGVDLLLEKLGIGSGEETERIEEADTLLNSGDPDAAFILLGEYLEQLATEGNTEAVVKVERHIELAATKSNPNAAAAQEKVALLKAFIQDNKGEGRGLDGRDFGQGIAEIARSKPEAGGEREPGPLNHAGPKDGKGKAPDHAGPKD